jgi:hypothetical protein
MIITDRFVYVHAPKTGGTFVSAGLFDLHGVRWNWLTHVLSSFRRELVYDTRYGRFIYHNNKHGTCSEIPASGRGRLVLATVRNPYDLYVSEYEFGWWKRRELRPYLEAVPEFGPLRGRFPDITFAEYVPLVNAAFRTHPGSDVGLLTQKFVSYYARDPAGLLPRLDEAYVASRQFWDDLYPVRFLRTHRLNADLAAFLGEMGYAEEDLAHVRGRGKVLPSGKGRRADQRWERYYTPELRRLVREKERLLFALFPEFDEEPAPPAAAAADAPGAGRHGTTRGGGHAG